MISVFEEHSTGFASTDLLYLRQQLVDAMTDLFPLPAAFSFFRPGADDPAEDLPLRRDGELACHVKGMASGLVEPTLVRKVLVMPLQTWDKQSVYLLIHDVDHAFLAKMDKEWLGSLQKTMQHRVDKLRLPYVDPVSGLYNTRCLRCFLESVDVRSGASTLFVVGIRLPMREASKRSQAGRRLAIFFADFLPRPPFLVDSGLFAFFRDGSDASEHNAFARKLLRRLRRLGIAGAHIGYTLLSGEKTATDEVLHRCWRALEVAGRQGPFGLCGDGCSSSGMEWPLEQPWRDGYARLRLLWRALPAFALVLVRTDDANPADFPAGPDMALGKGYDPVFAVHAGRECCFLLPGRNGQDAVRWADGLIRHFRVTGLPAISAGVAVWPFHGMSKTAALDCSHKALQHARLLGPESVALYDHLSCNVSGDLHFERGDYRGAVREYQAGLRMCPEDINLLNSLGVCLVELGRRSHGLKLFEKALEKEPENSMALANAGYACQELGRLEQARDYLKKAVSLGKESPDLVSPELYSQLARLYLLFGQYAEAAALLTSRPRDSGGEKGGFFLQRLLGEALLENGEHEAAIRTLQDALRQHPHDRESLSMLGRLYGVHGQGEQLGLDLCRRALVDHDDSAFCWYQQASLLYALQRDGEAEVSVLRGLDADSGHPALLLLMAQILERTGRRRKAAVFFRLLMKNKRSSDRHKEIAVQSLRRLNHNISTGGKKRGTD